MFVLLFLMSLSSLKRAILAAFPVVGPHTGIESDLMLSGQKPLTWIYANSSDKLPETIESRAQKRLDEAVSQGKLIAMDVEQRYSDNLEDVAIFRHYAQPDQKRNLERVAAFNRCAFNGEDCTEAEAHLNQDLGAYLGYRRRDILLFNYVINSSWLPKRAKMGLIRLNSYCQSARRDQLLLESGQNLKDWYDNVPNYLM